MRMSSVAPLSALRSPLSALRACSAGAGNTLAACLILSLGAMAQQSVRIPYSTHDWTVSGAEPITAFPEAWADVKSPGDGRQYTVGTIEVQYTGVGAEFSEEFAFPVTGASGFDFTLLGVRRQVVMLQCTDATQSIVWQRYFYGSSTEAALRASNARAVAVWPTGIPTTTRIAICGETYDERLPEEGEGLEFTAATATSPTGFIAVLNGAGDLLWTHHVFGSDPSQSCAITDVSIRVEPDGRETVTYCGISSHGDPGAGVPLSPVKPFAPITEDPVSMVPTSSGGDTDHGLFQWDGIVGRVSFVPGEGKGIEFHSIVGGLEQDGLFGLAEIVFEPEGRDRFAVVGATQWASAT